MTGHPLDAMSAARGRRQIPCRDDEFIGVGFSRARMTFLRIVIALYLFV
jgi:hypothetical protein